MTHLASHPAEATSRGALRASVPAGPLARGAAVLSLALAQAFGAACAHPATAAGRHPGEGAGHRHPSGATPGAAHTGGHGGGHAHAHRFENAEHWAARFEGSEREAWQRPARVIEALTLQEDHRVADIGSATGYFPVRIAPHVPRGRVWGVDVEPDMVRYLNARARREGIGHLFSALGTATDPLLPEPMDRVLLVDTYHHIEGRPAYFTRVARGLRPGGRIVIVDFKPGDLPIGPKAPMKIAPERVEAEMREAGCAVLARDDESLPYQFIRTFTCEGITPSSEG